jgi:hypothetical protein
MDAPAPSRRLWLSHEWNVLIVIAILSALGLGWLGWQANWIRQRHAFLAEMKPRFDALSNSEVLIFDGGSHPRFPTVAPWPLRYFGEEERPTVDVPLPKSSPESVPGGGYLLSLLTKATPPSRPLS